MADATWSFEDGQPAAAAPAATSGGWSFADGQPANVAPETAGRVFGLTGRAIVTGLGNTFDTVANAAEQADPVVGLAAGAARSIDQEILNHVEPGAQIPTSAAAAVTSAANAAGLPTPDTHGERMYSAGVAGATGAVLAPEASIVGAISGAASGLASQGVAEAGGSPTEQTLAGLATGLGSGLIIGRSAAALAGHPIDRFGEATGSGGIHTNERPTFLPANAPDVPGTTPEGGWTAPQLEAGQPSFGQLTAHHQTTMSDVSATETHGSPGTPAPPAPGAAPATRAVVPVDHSAQSATGGSSQFHTFTSPNGYTSAIERPNNTLQVIDTRTDPGAQGHGEGQARLIAAYQQAASSGRALVSDTSVSPEASNVYDALQRRGWGIIKNPSAQPIADGGLQSTDTRPVYTVTGPPMKGMPLTADVPGAGTVQIGPNGAARQAAADYMRSTGRPYNPPTDYVVVDPDKATKVAAAYDAMPHAPADPAVASSYKALIDETKAQYQYMKAAGLNVEFMRPGENPYAGSPRLAQLDVRNNNHLWVYPTQEGFGGAGETAAAGNPMLGDSGERFGAQPATINDLFRAVHDYYGHIAEGNGFRGTGEYNAYLLHRAMYSDAAQPALASETLGQNAWVNYGPHGAANRTASEAETVFAPQKSGIMPKSVWGSDNPAGKEPAPIDLGTPGGTPYTMVSAERAALSPEENATRTAALEQDLKHSGMPYRRTLGSYQGSRENSFAVATPDEASRAKAAALGNKYDQDEVFHVDENRQPVSRLKDGTLVPREGTVREVTPEEALGLQGWTMDDQGRYYSSEVPRRAAPTVAAPVGDLKGPVQAGVWQLPRGGKLPAADIAARKQRFEDIGLGGSGTKIRTSALTGNPLDAADDYMLSGKNSKGGQHMAAVLANERQAVRSFVERIRQDAGGTMDTTSPTAVGQTIMKPLESYKQTMKAVEQQLYTGANAQGQQLPFKLDNTMQFLKDNEAEFAATPDGSGERLLNGLQKKMKALKLTDGGTGTVAQVQRLRQFVGQPGVYSFQNARLVQGLKDAMDDDTAAAAGHDIYQMSRAQRAMRDAVLDKPKLVSKAMQDDGTNRAVPYEQIPSKVAAAPLDQFTHFIRAVKQSGVGNPSTAKEAAASLNEIRSQFANGYQAAGDSTAGMWNAKAANAYLRANADKMALVFSRGELSRFKLANDVGNDLYIDRSYKGAAVQAHNMLRLTAHGLKYGATAIGGLSHGVVGAILGHTAGAGAEKLAEGIQEPTREIAWERIDNLLRDVAVMTGNSGGGGGGDVVPALAGAAPAATQSRQP